MVDSSGGCALVAVQFIFKVSRKHCGVSYYLVCHLHDFPNYLLEFIHVFMCVCINVDRVLCAASVELSPTYTCTGALWSRRVWTCTRTDVHMC